MPYKDIEKRREYNKHWMRRYRQRLKAERDDCFSDPDGDRIIEELEELVKTLDIELREAVCIRCGQPFEAICPNCREQEPLF